MDTRSHFLSLLYCLFTGEFILSFFYSIFQRFPLSKKMDKLWACCSSSQRHFETINTLYMSGNSNKTHLIYKRNISQELSWIHKHLTKQLIASCQILSHKLTAFSVYDVEKLIFIKIIFHDFLVYEIANLAPACEYCMFTLWLG